jgi:CHAT domain-containing protein
MAASSLRAMVASNAPLAKLMRVEQDLSNQLSAQVGALNNLLSLPPDQRTEADLKSVGTSIDRLRIEQQNAREEIAKRFPLFAELINPKPPTVEQVGAAMKRGETFLSFYFGRSKSFVWAIPKDGTPTFTEIGVTRAQIEEKITKLRGSLDPQGPMISDIPPFDLGLSHELYALLLEQIEPTWKSSRSLIVATNGTLALMPLSLLPTEPVAPENDGDLLFSSYRAVPWLARTHAVSMVPSAAAFTTVRRLPPGKPERDELIAFGDPLFSAEQAAESGKIEAKTEIAAAGDSKRGLPLTRRASAQLNGIDSAELALLPRLPDTAEELRSMAEALHADPSKALHLGKDANEGAVKTVDLTGFKVVAFATHGLVPGELNGLTQPALALSAPAISGGKGDGLLTMEEILSLRLDADWVVLSACNTGAGLEAGMEAASGLGRAFFYAGTRAILVTNWSVHSQSARELVGDLFKRQTQDSKLSRGEALREAMMSLVDGAGYVGASGKMEFAYAHPLFWAPYSIIGDGGVR